MVICTGCASLATAFAINTRPALFPVKPTAFLLILTGVLLSGCTDKAMSARIIDDGTQFPPELGLSPDTMLAVLHGSNAYDRVLTNTLARYYTGPYKLVTTAELSGTFTDVDIYRYVFDSVVKERDMAMSAAEAGTRFHVVDRKAKRTYSADQTTKAYGKLMAVYLQKLDAKRIANGGR